MQHVNWQVHVSTWLRFFGRNRLAPYHVTPHHAQLAMLELAKPKEVDTMMDIGCGDGSLMLTAAKETACKKIIGVECDSRLFEATRSRIESHQPRLNVIQGDARNIDLTDVSIITMYLSHHGNAALVPILTPHLTKNQNARAVSFWFPIKSYTPIQTVRVSAIPIYLYNHKSIT